MRKPYSVAVIPIGGLKQMREAMKPKPFPVDIERPAQQPAPDRKAIDGVKLVKCDLPAIDLRRDRGSFGEDF